MPIPPDDTDLAYMPGGDLCSEGFDFAALDQFLEGMNDAGRSTLLQWARLHVPNLLYALTVSFLTQASCPEVKKTTNPCPPLETPSVLAATKRLKASTLRAIERQYIARVISESATIREAASRLGIAGTTLWRKRKRYGLGSEQKSPAEGSSNS